MKNILNFFASLSERVYIAIFIIIIIASSTYIYLLKEDTRILEQKIAAKQHELGRITKLKDLYQAKKGGLERPASKGIHEKTISLGMIEEVVLKSFPDGKLTMLKPSMIKEDRGGSAHRAFEVKVGGAALGEIITFVKILETTGLYVKKLQLTIPASNQTVIDMYAVVTGG
ncbi:MAG: hypothetical protein C0399_11900 [Syntrophus sp. (in: bacteria)]|nr:hypothetical protein [Syntrophus sp. (in: bacteria)]MBA4418988.1 hypothetical protein [Syntrophus sp. (in: bacteria)]